MLKTIRGRSACEHCVYWERLELERPFIEAQDEGLCRRQAPIAIPSRSISDAGEDDGGVQGLIAAWPRTFQEDWCGEYRCVSDLRGRGKEEDQEGAA